MKKLIFSVFLLALFTTGLIAQDFNNMTGAQICSMRRSKTHLPETDFLYSPNTPRHSFDVQNYKLNVDLYACYFSPYPKSFKASNTMTFKVDSTLSSINLNANNTSLTIDSIRLVGGPVLVYAHSNNILTITMNRTYNVGEVATIVIYYRHNNVTDNSFYNSGSTGYVFTDAEPEGARGWFPCWDRPFDKATLDLTAKVASTVRLGSNGRLNDSTITGDSIYYHWVSRDPISTYLMVMTSKVGYTIDIVYWHKISNPSDSIPLRLYSPSGTSSASIKAIMNTMTDYYSNTWGEHPFEKNGFCYVPSSAGFIWGGMENQTLTTIYAWSQSVCVHEYAHQWFGDMITCATWSNIWLNEGFATWNEAYWQERTGGYAAYKSAIINNDASDYLSYNPGWAISVPSWDVTTPDENTLFNYEITYCKGACVLHLLRYTLGDSLFFAAMKSYATDTVNFKFKNSTIPDFFTKIGSVAGQDLSWFYNAWIYQPNHPQYQNGYNITNVGSGQWRVNFLAKQVQTNAGFFPIPIQVKVSFTTGADTTVKVMNSANNQLFSFYFNRQPTAVVFDPTNEIVIKTASLVLGIDETTPMVPAEYKLSQNYPNPFNPVTTIDYDIPRNSNVKLAIYDMTGREVAVPVNEFKTAGKYSLNFNAMKLASGIYYYRLQAGDFTETRKMTLLK
ncbi:MAG: T9SS type A sorting domain-containing protein [Bacteroidetes bacterium]|nr:T9SS type A sorting domain-containing protein [Bacteroidota bacterium]